MREQWHRVSRSHGYREGVTAAGAGLLHVFDMDGTLLPGTTASLEIAKAIDGQSWIHDLEEDFRHGLLDTKGFASALHAGWSDLTPQIVAEAFTAAPKLTGIRRTIAALRQAGDHAVVLSMSPDFFVGHFSDYGFDAAIGSRFPSLPFATDLDHSGVLAFDDKPRIVTDLCQDLGVSLSCVVAYGDSQSDVPLFGIAGTSVAVNADHHVSELATTAYQGEDLYDAYLAGLRARQTQQADRRHPRSS